MLAGLLIARPADFRQVGRALPGEPQRTGTFRLAEDSSPSYEARQEESMI